MLLELIKAIFFIFCVKQFVNIFYRHCTLWIDTSLVHHSIQKILKNNDEICLKYFIMVKLSIILIKTAMLIRNDLSQNGFGIDVFKIFLQLPEPFVLIPHISTNFDFNRNEELLQKNFNRKLISEKFE